MHVLFLIHSLAGGGAERTTASLANHWASRGWRVTVVTLASADRDFYELHPGVERVALGLVGRSGGWERALVNHCARSMAVRRVIQARRPDIALGVMTTANVLLAWSAVGRERPALIGTEHVYPPASPLPAVWSWLRRVTYPRLDLLAAPSPETARWITEHTRVRRTVVVPNPVAFPLPNLSPRVAPNRVGAPWRRRLLAVGRLATEKGFDLLLRAWARLVATFPDWELVIVGEGPERPMLETLAKHLGISDSVFLPGAVGNIGDWYGSANLYVMSSRSEGFGNSLAEALAYGVPGVSFDCKSGPREIVRHGVDGLLVPPGDVAGLAEALSRAMADETLRRSLGLRAVEARERFALERIAVQWEEAFESCLGRSLRP